MLFSAKIAALEGQLAAVTLERDTHAASIVELTQANADCKERHDADQALILSLTGERDQFKADAGRLTTELAAAGEAKVKADEHKEAAVDKEVKSRLANAGVDPVRRDPSAAIDKTSGEKSGLQPRQRLAASINQKLTK